MKTERKRDLTKDLILSVAVIFTGLMISGFAGAGLYSHRFDVAQATPPLQSTPGADAKPSAPNTTGESKGARPTEVAPEPARPDPNEVKAGTPSALPPAPAEKVAPPIQAK